MDNNSQPSVSASQSGSEASASNAHFAPIPALFWASYHPHQLEAARQFYAVAWQRARAQVQAQAEAQAHTDEWRDFDFDLSVLRRFHALLADFPA